MIINSKKGLIAQVSLVLLLLISVVIFFQVSQWYLGYLSQTEAESNEIDFDRNFEIAKIEGTKVFINNQFQDDLNLNSIRINDIDCPIGEITISRGLAIVDIGDCASGIDPVTRTDIAIVTDFGVKFESEIGRNLNVSTLSVSFELTPCDFSARWVRVFGLSDFNNAHVERGNQNSYSYNVCVRHRDYDIGTESSGINQLLFYLMQPTNSHVFTDTSSIIRPHTDWHPVHISSSGGTFYYQTSVTQPNSSFVCIGSLNIDNVYGAHFGDCSSGYPTKLWLSLS